MVGVGAADDHVVWDGDDVGVGVGVDEDVDVDVGVGVDVGLDVLGTELEEEEVDLGVVEVVLGGSEDVEG